MSDERMPSAEKLVSLSTASDEIMQGILTRDRKGTQNTIVAKVHELLEAESCAVFLVKDDDRRKLKLETAYTDKKENEFDAVELVIQSIPGRGLTGHLAFEGQPVELHGKQLKENKYVARRPPDHLISGHCFSLLAIPLKDRKGRLIGLLKVENKKGPGGRPGEEFYFTEDDTSVANILANKVVIVLETLHASQIFRGLTEKMYAAKDVDEIFQTCLNEAVRLVHADRGDLATWDGIKQDLIIPYQNGELGVLQSEPLPTPSIIREVWSKGEPYIASSVSKNPDYFCGNVKTESEIAVPLKWEEQMIGVLNIESYQEDGLDALDIAVLQLLAQHAVTAYRAVHKEAYFRGIVQGLGQTSVPADMLTRILRCVEAIYGFDGGLIYIADHTNRKLRCQSFISAKPVDIKNPEEFSYNFEDVSLSTHVLQHREPYFSPDPLNDERVNRKGIEAFRVEGPLLGIPLIFSQEVFGVLVVWSSSDQQSPAERHKLELGPLAQLAATVIAISETSNQRALVLQAIENILYKMRTAPVRETVMKLILEGVQQAGFERARVFEYREDPARFVVVDSLGMSKPASLRGRDVFISKNIYAKDTKETALGNPSARRYDPTANDTPTGPDPDARIFEKPDDLPWAAVPLLVAGGLYGQITADNARTKRPITKGMLDYLTLMGAVAAHVIESARTRYNLQALALPIPPGNPASADHRLLTIKQFLVSLVARFGFNRAFFFEQTEDVGNLRYYAGLSKEACQKHVQGAHERSPEEQLASLFDRAAELDDLDSNSRLDDLTISRSEVTAQVPLNERKVHEFSSAAEHSWPKWIDFLATTLDVNHLLLAPVLAGKDSFGLLFVEPQEQHLGDADQKALAITADHLAQILRQYRLQRFTDHQIAEADPDVRRLHQQTITICFWDIRGFTGLCEILKTQPTLISGFLKEYYQLASEVVGGVRGGIIDKFIGDGVMALFGVLDEVSDFGANPAVDAAIEFRFKFAELVDQWNVKWARETTVVVPKIKLGCGINTSNVLVGEVGAKSLVQFTALGPGVNFASRIEKLSKQGEILISQPTNGRLNSSVARKQFRKKIKDIPGIPGDHLLFSVTQESPNSKGE
ncbi:MAG TPA: GAF domain-containing protein [Pyrinomonadaceae bacterium]|nr:GAF domain-containing protein [Pyrinomonadaceae bacterium]